MIFKVWGYIFIYFIALELDVVMSPTYPNLVLPKKDYCSKCSPIKVWSIKLLYFKHEYHLYPAPLNTFLQYVK